MARKVVVSASRRTDMVACQPQRLADALEGKLRFAASLRPERVHTLLLSTKDFRPFLDNSRLNTVARRCDQVCVNLTITGLGGTRLEPAVPAPEGLLGRLGELARAVGDPRRITWCFDPVLACEGVSNHDLGLFRRLAEPFASVGARRVMAMFYFPYGNARVEPQMPSQEERLAFAGAVQEECDELGLLLSFCHVPGFHRTKCIDLDWFSELHPTGDTSVVEHYRRIKRPDASYCRDAVWDVGWYLPPCAHGCLYCYAVSERTTPPREAGVDVPGRQRGTARVAGSD